MVSNDLPPMPPSDMSAMERNAFDGFYKVKSRDFWKDNVVVREKIRPDVKCEHEFKVTRSGAQCTKCNFGLIGQIEVRDKNLFFKGKKIDF